MGFACAIVHSVFDRTAIGYDRSWASRPCHDSISMHLRALRIRAIVENQFVNEQAARAEEDRATKRVAGEDAQSRHRDLALDGGGDRERAVGFTAAEAAIEAAGDLVRAARGRRP